VLITPRLAAYYRRRANAVSGQTVLSPRAAGYVGLHESFEQIANGRLAEARESLEGVLALFKVCGYDFSWRQLKSFSRNMRPRFVCIRGLL